MNTDVEEVLRGEAAWSICCDDAIKWMDSFPAQSVHMVIGSPPYPTKDRYGSDQKKWKVFDWVDWMFDVTLAACRVSKGDVLWVVNGPVVNNEYHAAVEGLIWKVYQHRWLEQGNITCERPCVWHKNAAPNRKNWFANNWEFVVCFRRVDSVRHWDWEAIAEPPKYKAGGRFRQRNAKGERVLGNEYPQVKLARPKDVIRATVGGGHMGSKLASENEAPFPEKLIEPFVRSLCPVGGILCDPFGGSFSTLSVALKNNRRFVGCDLRQSQVDLGMRRAMETENGITKEAKAA